MVCPECEENEGCPDCEKHPLDIHTTPPNRYIDVGNGFVIDPRPPRLMIEAWLSQLEREINDLRNQLQETKLRNGLM